MPVFDYGQQEIKRPDEVSWGDQGIRRGMMNYTTRKS